MIKETIEKAAENYAHNYFNMHEINNYKALKQGFEAGAKWQQEKMYSEEEVINIANYAFGFYRRNDLSDDELEDEFNRMLIKKFKNKNI